MALEMTQDYLTRLGDHREYFYIPTFHVMTENLFCVAIELV